MKHLIWIPDFVDERTSIVEHFFLHENYSLHISKSCSNFCINLPFEYTQKITLSLSP